MGLEVVPLTFRQACAYIAETHRHHKPPQGMKIAVGAFSNILRGVAVIGRPVSRVEDTGLCCEVTRTCTDGYPNVNSFLYGICRRLAKDMGYERCITYTENGESGASLRAAGWILEAELDARGNWHDSSRKLRAIRDKDGRGGIKRYRWRAW